MLEMVDQAQRPSTIKTDENSEHGGTFAMAFDQLTRVQAALLFSTSGARIAGQYYTSDIPESTRSTFETDFFAKLGDATRPEACQVGDHIAVIRTIQDMVLVLIGGESTNELLFSELLDTIEAALGLLFKKLNAEGVTAQIEDFYLLLDETIHEGFALETDGETVAARVLLKDDNALAGKGKTPASRAW
jgi:hypothetical protein